VPNEKNRDVLIGGRWRPARNPAGFFRATDPSTGDEIEGLYPLSDASDIEEALAAASAVVQEMVRTGPAAIAEFLD